MKDTGLISLDEIREKYNIHHTLAKLLSTDPEEVKRLVKENLSKFALQMEKLEKELNEANHGNTTKETRVSRSRRVCEQVGDSA